MGSLSACKSCLGLQGLGSRVQGLHGGSYPPDISLDDLPSPKSTWKYRAGLVERGSRSLVVPGARNNPKL